MKVKILALLFLSCICSPTFAEERTSIISITGNGTVSAEPDEVHIVVGVNTVRPFTSHAMQENSRIMNNLYSSLEKFGFKQGLSGPCTCSNVGGNAPISGKCICPKGCCECGSKPIKSILSVKTVNLSLHEYLVSDGNNGYKKNGYKASNVVEITLCDINKLGGVLDAIVGCGVDVIGNIEFTSSRSKDFIKQARTVAVEDAVSKANNIASLLGVKLKRIVSVAEYAGLSRDTHQYTASAPGDNTAPVSGGSLTFEASVSVVWEIDNKESNCETKGHISRCPQKTICGQLVY